MSGACVARSGAGIVGREASLEVAGLADIEGAVCADEDVDVGHGVGIARSGMNALIAQTSFVAGAGDALKSPSLDSLRSLGTSRALTQGTIRLACWPAMSEPSTGSGESKAS